MCLCHRCLEVLIVKPTETGNHKKKTYARLISGCSPKCDPAHFSTHTAYHTYHTYFSTKMCLSRQNYVRRGQTRVVATKRFSRHKLYLWQPPPMIALHTPPRPPQSLHPPNTCSTDSQYNITFLPSVNTLIARVIFCSAKYTHHTFTPIIKHLITTTTATPPPPHPPPPAPSP